MSHDVNAYYNEAMKYAEKVVDNAEQKVFGNRAAWELVKGYAKMFRS